MNAQATAGVQEDSGESDLWLRPVQAAEVLGVDRVTLARWAKKGKLPSRRTKGGHRRYREPDVRALKGTRNQHHGPGPAMKGAAEYVRSHPGCSKADVRHATGHQHEAIERAIQAGMITAVRSSLSPRRYRLYPPQSEGTEW